MHPIIINLRREKEIYFTETSKQGKTRRETQQHTCTTLDYIISTESGSVASTAVGERAAAVAWIAWPT